MKGPIDTITVDKIHPVSGKMRKCMVFLNYFGSGEDAFRFEGEKVIYTKDELELMTPPQSG